MLPCRTFRLTLFTATKPLNSRESCRVSRMVWSCIWFCQQAVERLDGRVNSYHQDTMAPRKSDKASGFPFAFLGALVVTFPVLVQWPTDYCIDAGRASSVLEGAQLAASGIAGQQVLAREFFLRGLRV